jgi:hypothetical protein
MVRWGASAGVEWFWESGRSRPVGGAAPGPRSAAFCSSTSARADLGCSYSVATDLAHSSGCPNLGRRAATPTARARAGAIVGRAGDRRAARPDVGLACACAVAGRAAAPSIMGCAQARVAGAPATRAIVEWRRRSGRACGRTVVGLGRNRIGGAAARILGHSGKVGPQCRPERGAVVG